MARHDYWPRYGLENYSYVFPYEDGFDGATSTGWMQEHWTRSLWSSAAYIAVIFGGRKLMEDRKPLSLDGPLFLWNLGLAVFSICGFVRMTPEWIWSFTGEGNSLRYSICVASFAQAVSGFWTEQFAFSKIFELLDTVFIVVRKRPLLFLHWYHHITVLVYTWHAYKDHTASGRWFIWMNYGVHSVMYSYYAIKSLKWSTPKWISMLITVLQISQMVVGIIIGIAVYHIKSSGGECQQTWENLYLNLGMYFSYFLLFCNFFYQSYLKKNNRYTALSKAKKAIEDEDKVKEKNAEDKEEEKAEEEEKGEKKKTAEKNQNKNGPITRRRAQKAD